MGELTGRAQAVILVASVLAPSLLTAQTQRRYIRAYGDASVSVRPDQARISASIITTAQTAQEAGSLNATRTSAVIDQLRALLGANADIRTAGYSLSPNYNYPRDSAPVLTGFTATNSLTVTVNEINAAGRVIDTAIQAGATRVDGLRFGLRDEEPARAQALRSAGQKARAKAEAIAMGLNVHLGAVLSAEEGVAVRAVGADRAVAGTVTPVEPGMLEVQATVTLDVEIQP